MNVQALESLPVNGMSSDFLTVGTGDEVTDVVVEPDVGPLTDNPFEDVSYDESAEISNFLPVGKQQE